MCNVCVCLAHYVIPSSEGKAGFAGSEGVSVGPNVSVTEDVSAGERVPGE